MSKKFVGFFEKELQYSSKNMWVLSKVVLLVYILFSISIISGCSESSEKDTKLTDFETGVDSYYRELNLANMIIFNLDGSGINTLGLSAGINFDYVGDGFAERTGWVSSSNGLLVWDRNANGVIDSGQELFGSETRLSNGMQAVNGFAALAELDTNGDGIIDANDPIFSELRVWVDANINGRTDEGELLTLEQAGVQSISTAYANSTYIDANGNEHRQLGSFVTTEGETRTATDVWFQTDAAYSIPTEWVEVSDDISALPDARGYGLVRNLHQAMAMDGSGRLQSLVGAFVAADTRLERDNLMTDIIYHWAGVQDVDPYSRASKIDGNVIGDARRLEVIERFRGTKWVGYTLDPNPNAGAATVLLGAWNDLRELVYGQLMARSHLKDLFLDIRYGWDAETESIVGDLSGVVSSLSELIVDDRENGMEILSEFVRSVHGIGLADSLNMASFKTMMSALGEDVTDILDNPLTEKGGGKTKNKEHDTFHSGSRSDIYRLDLNVEQKSVIYWVFSTTTNAFRMAA